MKALLASAESVSRRELMRELKQTGIDSVVCEDAKSTWAALQQPESPLLIFLDVNLPGTEIAQFCERVRSLNKGDEFFLCLLLAGKDIGELEIANSLEVDDCISRPFITDELRMRVRTWHHVAKLQLRFSLRASHDSLTGLWNHGLIMDVAQREIERAGRESSPMAILVSDIDDLNEINARLGSQGGDSVLFSVADRMRVALRSYDMFGRYGGGKYMAVLPKCTRANALEVAERLRNAVTADEMKVSGETIPVTVSIGVASLMPGQVANANKMFRAADHALFRAKQKGGNSAELAVSLKSRAGKE